MFAEPAVSATTTCTVVDPRGVVLGSIKVRFEYDPDDPLVVRLVLGWDLRDPSPWIASREVLKTAFLDLEPAGFGDLTCVPVDSSIEPANLCRGWVRLTFTGQDDDLRPIMLEVLAPPVVIRQFLRATYFMVPEHDECKRLVIPDTIASMFGDTERGSA